MNHASLFAATTLLLAACSGSGQAQSDAARELVVYRPSDSTFYVGKGDATVTQLPFGTAGDVPLWADFNGDGKPDPGLYRKGLWLISTHANGKPDLTINFGGLPGDIPIAADMDGDGRADLVVFRKGEWQIRNSRNPALIQILHFGADGDVPLLADMDGDGKIDLVLFRSGQWLVDTHRDGKVALTFAFGGVAGERALAADWSETGRAAPVLFRAGQWLVGEGRDGKVSARATFGVAGDIPLAVWHAK